MTDEHKRSWKPGPVVWAVAAAGVIVFWVVVALNLFYGLVLHPVDVAANAVIFMTLAGWWTEAMQND